MSAAALPPRPDFPVYGLSAAFPGQRWLEGSTTQKARRGADRLWQIELGHTNPLRHTTVIVVSDAKLPPLATGQPGTGLRDAATRALRGAYELTGLSGNAVALQGEAARLESARPLDELGWIRFRAVVESQTHEFVTRTVGLAWAAAVDLGDAAVGMYGIGATLDECVLARVNDRLEDYQPLPQVDELPPAPSMPAVPDLATSDFQHYSVQRVAFIADNTRAGDNAQLAAMSAPATSHQARRHRARSH